MMPSVKFNVCIARKYQDRTGAEKTHFWGVGKAFLNQKPDGKKVINIQLYSRTLMVDELVLFEDNGEERLAQAVRERPNQQALDDVDDDDIPF
jgi:hypothetical protein